MKMSVQIEMDYIVCAECGFPYAKPTAVRVSEKLVCPGPYCRHRRATKVARLFSQIAELERSNASLRGVITRMKRRWNER